MTLPDLRAAWTSELVKILTVRGLRVGAALALAAIPLTSLLVVSTGGLGDGDTVTSGAATGSVIGLLAYGVWAAATSASEYVHDTMIVSLASVPRRSVLFGAKIAALGAVAGAGALISALLAFFLVHAATPSGHHLGTPASLLAIVVAVVAVAVAGAAVAVLVRSSTAAIAIVAAAVLLPKAAAGLLGGLQPWVVGASPGTVITQSVNGAQLAHDQTYPGGTTLAILTMVAVAAVVVIGSGIAFARRDG
jgi:ABC-2 type transport system permease protein